MSKPLVLTCDIGTQSARALLVDPDGRIVDVVQSKYAEPYFSKEPGWAEQKPNFYFDRLCECCRELCARSNALLPDVIAMTITVIRDTVVCLDANNEPLRDIILWLDKRTVDPNGAMPAKNMMLFKVAGMEPTAKVGYHPSAFIMGDDVANAALNFLERGWNGEDFHEVTENLRTSDPYMVMADFKDYRRAQADLQRLYADREKWAQMSLKNTANSGIFSADRSVLDYARDIWHASAVK